MSGKYNNVDEIVSNKNVFHHRGIPPLYFLDSIIQKEIFKIQKHFSKSKTMTERVETNNINGKTGVNALNN